MHQVGPFLLTLIHDARNHEFKIQLHVVTQYLYLAHLRLCFQRGGEAPAVYANMHRMSFVTFTLILDVGFVYTYLVVGPSRQTY